jgi:hypothetical protein
VCSLTRKIAEPKRLTELFCVKNAESVPLRGEAAHAQIAAGYAQIAVTPSLVLVLLLTVIQKTAIDGLVCERDARNGCGGSSRGLQLRSPK